MLLEQGGGALQWIYLPRAFPRIICFLSKFPDLPDTPVDLVINCLDCHENPYLREQPWYRAAVEWGNQNRAPVLSIDPPVGELEHVIDAKWSLALGLPLPLGESAGRLYLCDIGIPKKVFQEVGISYHSPFGCKFVIPLHSAWSWLGAEEEECTNCKTLRRLAARKVWRRIWSLNGQLTWV